MDTIFARDLRSTALRVVENLTVNGGSVTSLGGADLSTKRILTLLLEVNVLSRKDMEEAMHKVIVDAGKFSFLQHKTRGVYPDHTASPEALGYVIQLKILTVQDIDSIRFDHNETAESFPSIYNPRGSSFCSYLVDQLLSEEDIPLLNFSESGSECMDHH